MVKIDKHKQSKNLRRRADRLDILIDMWKIFIFFDKPANVKMRRFEVGIISELIENVREP